VADAWARATPPGVDVGAAYLSIHGGDRDDRLLAAATVRAKIVELHTVIDEGGVARMRPLEFLDVPAGKRVVLEPQGTHLMLIGLTGPLVAGEELPLRLQFAEAGDIEITVLVKPATEQDEHSHHHH
jgi:copper(I)-binding protein